MPRRRRVRSMRAALDPRRAQEFRQAFEGEIRSLRDLYRKAASDMMQVLADAAATPLTRARAIAHLRQYQTILANLGDEAAAWMQLNLPETYKLGVEFSNGNIGDLRRAGINMRRRQRDVFSQVHREAVAAIVQEMQRTTDFAFAQIGRRANDVFRRVGVEEVAKGIAEGKTRVEVSRQIEKRLLAEGKPVFKDALGREWQLDRYAEMVARTTTREAMSEGTINRLRDHGVRLAQVVPHPCSDFCTYYQGVVVCIEGTHPAYPDISTIGGPPPWHPNCRDVLAPFIEALATDEEKRAGEIKPELLDRTPAQLQRRFRSDFPKQAQAEGKRIRQEGTITRRRAAQSPSGPPT